MHIGIETTHASFAHNLSHRSTESFLIHNHPTYELYYYLQGSASFLINGTEYPLEPHTLLIFPPNSFHGIRVTDEQPYDRYTLHFHADCLSLERRTSLMRALPRAEKTGDIPCLRQNMEGTAMHALLTQLEACAAHDIPTQERLLPILLEAMLATVILASPTQAIHAGEAHVSAAQENIITYVNEHFTENITLDDLAERFFLSKHHLNRVFRKATGTTVRDYLISKRVIYVQQLLINGIPATQASTLAGFGDYTAFYRAYTKRFGHAPSQDRGHSRTTPFDLQEVLKEQLVITPDAYKMKLEESS